MTLDLKSLIRAEKAQLVPCKTKGTVWDEFALVKTDGIIDEKYAVCKNCLISKYSIYDSKGNSKNFFATNNSGLIGKVTCLSSLKGHLAKCKEGSKTIPISRFTKFVPKNIDLPKETLENMKLLLAKFVTETYSSFRIVESDSLKNIIQCAIEIGSKYGDVDACSIMYARKSVKNHVFQMVEKINNKLKNSLAQKTNKHICLVTDIWSDSSNHNSFIDLTLFYVENFILKHQMLAFR